MRSGSLSIRWGLHGLLLSKVRRISYPAEGGSIIVELRRRAPRIPTDWPGRCRFDDFADGGLLREWMDCRVVDISLLGVSVEIEKGGIGLVEGRFLDVHVESPAGRSVRLQILGTVVHQRSPSEGRTRVGLQFVDLSDSEKAILEVIEQLEMFW